MQAYYIVPADAGIVDPGWGVRPGGGHPVDPGWGIPGVPGGGHPGQLPTFPGHPSQGLPGFGGFPGHPSQGLPFPGFPGHPSQGLPGGFPGRPVDPGWGVGGAPEVSPPITLPPSTELPPDQIWPPLPPGTPPTTKPVVPPDKLAILILVLGVGHKWMIIDKSWLPPVAGQLPGQPPMPGQPPVAQPK
jgi:hypothetical protein